MVDDGSLMQSHSVGGGQLWPTKRSTGLKSLTHHLVILTTLLVGVAASASTILVPEDALSIQHAIDLAKPGDVVEIGPGRYLEQIDLRGKSILLRGRDGAAKTIIDAANRNESVVWCVAAEGPGTVLEGLTLTGGTGHIGIHGSDTAIGGGLLALGASPTIRDCIFKANAVNRNGGGAYCGKGSDVRFERCQFVENTAEKGAGVLAVASRPVFIDCAFKLNRADYSGGGVFAAKGSAPVFRGCTFEKNRATYQGGGLCSLESAGEILDSTFERNFAGGRGGALYLGFRTSMTASACSFEAKTDSVVGGDEIVRGEAYLGVCDLSATVCVLSEKSDCLAAGGIFRGKGTRCPAVDTTMQARQDGDLNNDGDVNRSDMGILMLLWH